MDMTIYCGKCGKKMAVDAKKAGQKIVCVRCNTKLPLPSQPTDEPQIRLYCYGCGHRVRADIEQSGGEMRCPKCKEVIPLPAIDDSLVKVARNEKKPGKGATPQDEARADEGSRQAGKEEEGGREELVARKRRKKKKRREFHTADYKISDEMRDTIDRIDRETSRRKRKEEEDEDEEEDEKEDEEANGEEEEKRRLAKKKRGTAPRKSEDSNEFAEVVPIADGPGPIKVFIVVFLVASFLAIALWAGYYFVGQVKKDSEQPTSSGTPAATPSPSAQPAKKPAATTPEKRPAPAKSAPAKQPADTESAPAAPKKKPDDAKAADTKAATRPATEAGPPGGKSGAGGTEKQTTPAKPAARATGPKEPEPAKAAPKAANGKSEPKSAQGKAAAAKPPAKPEAAQKKTAGPSAKAPPRPAFTPSVDCLIGSVLVGKQQQGGTEGIVGEASIRLEISEDRSAIAKATITMKKLRCAKPEREEVTLPSATAESDRPIPITKGHFGFAIERNLIQGDFTSPTAAVGTIQLSYSTGPEDNREHYDLGKWEWKAQGE